MYRPVLRGMSEVSLLQRAIRAIMVLLAIRVSPMDDLRRSRTYALGRRDGNWLRRLVN